MSGSSSRSSPRFNKNKERYSFFAHISSTHKQCIWVKSPYPTTNGLIPQIPKQYTQLNYQQMFHRPNLGNYSLSNPHSDSVHGIDKIQQIIHNTSHRLAHKVGRRGKDKWVRVDDPSIIPGEMSTAAPASVIPEEMSVDAHALETPDTSINSMNESILPLAADSDIQGMAETSASSHITIPGEKIDDIVADVDSTVLSEEKQNQEVGDQVSDPPAMHTPTTHTAGMETPVTEPTPHTVDGNITSTDTAVGQSASGAAASSDSPIPSVLDTSMPDAPKKHKLTRDYTQTNRKHWCNPHPSSERTIHEPRAHGRRYTYLNPKPRTQCSHRGLCTRNRTTREAAVTAA
jgi:hypothetical protein